MNDGPSAWMKARPRFASDILARRVVLRGVPEMVLQDPATGRHWRSSIALYRLARLLDGRRTVGEAMRLSGIEEGSAEARTLLDGLSGMLSSGLLRLAGLQRSNAKRTTAEFVRPLLQRIVFARIAMGNLAPVVPIAMRSFGWLYTRGGTILLIALVTLAAWACAGEVPSIKAQLERLSDISAKNILFGWAMFATAKMLHEIGHAVAARRAGAAEGLDFVNFRWGISFMFLLPTPYVDVSSAWLLENRWRRAQVGLAGIEVDLFVAAIAALVWVEIGEGFLADRLFEVVLLCGASSLLFNANPLVRLDGYYVLSDLIGIPNLQTRGWAALRNLALFPLGLGTAPARASDLGLALYSAASWAWRWSVFAAIFWIASGISPNLGYAFATVIGILYLGIPIARGIGRWMSLARNAPVRSAVAPLVLGTVAAALFLVPVPVHVVAEGIAWNEGVTWVYAPSDGIVRTVARAGSTGATIVEMDNPELRRTLTQLRAEAEALDIEARRARASEQRKADALRDRQRAVAAQIAAVEDEVTTWSVVAPPRAVWHPLRAEALTAAWIRRDDQRPLGVTVADGPIMLRVVLDQWDGPAVLSALAAAPDREIPVRRRGDTAAGLHAVLLQSPEQARDEIPSPALLLPAGGQIPVRVDSRGTLRPAGRVFEVRLALSGEPPDPPLRHGARIEASIRLADASVAAIAWRRLRQALQRHLNL